MSYFLYYVVLPFTRILKVYFILRSSEKWRPKQNKGSTGPVLKKGDGTINPHELLFIYLFVTW